MVGRSAIGKSSTINSLLGEEVAPVGKYRPQTTDAETYSNFHDGVAFHGADTRPTHFFLTFTALSASKTAFPRDILARSSNRFKQRPAQEK
ncbi:GTPase [Burkholderia multivorans]|uniref:GTPase n=1 Tax=Burkholderia multivorans TaxID=87883 RepID=UPI003C12FA0B